MLYLHLSASPEWNHSCTFMKEETIHVYFWCWFEDFNMVVYEDWLILTLSNYTFRGLKFIGSIVSVKGLQTSVSESWTAQSRCLTSRETKTFKSDTLLCTAQIETRIRNDTIRDEVWKSFVHDSVSRTLCKFESTYTPRVFCPMQLGFQSDELTVN